MISAAGFITKDAKSTHLPGDDANKETPTISMNSQSDSKTDEKPELLGGTDQIEQLAADLAERQNRTRVTDQDRQKAREQLEAISPKKPVSQTEP